MRHILFYAAEGDLLPVFEAVESHGRLKYVRGGNFRSADIEAFSTGSELPNMGTATSESAASCESFLVCEAAASISVERSVAADGTERFCIDQLMNPDTVGLTPGGLWGQGVLLHGRVATASDSQTSQALMRRFASAIRKRFTKIRAFYLGPKALEMFGAGMRLTQAAQSPPEYDLKRD